MGRGRGKGKRGGRGGGGRQHFVSSLEELESRNDRDEAFAARRKAEREDDESGSDEEGKKGGSGSEESEGASEEEEGKKQGAAVAVRRAEPEEAPKKPKAKGVASLIEVVNPNAKVNAGRMMKAKVGQVGQVMTCVQRHQVQLFVLPCCAARACSSLVTCGCCFSRRTRPGGIRAVLAYCLVGRV